MKFPIEIILTKKSHYCNILGIFLCTKTKYTITKPNIWFNKESITTKFQIKMIIPASYILILNRKTPSINPLVIYFK